MTALRNARWPLAVFALALLPRLIGLGAKPFWLDEVFTLQRASLAPAALVRDSFLNHHMPSFFLMLSPLVSLGDPQYWLRLPSAVFGALSVMLVFIIATRIAGRTAGIIAAIIIGLSPTALAFSQEARSYTMVMCLILVALYGITKLALDIPAASQPIHRGSARAAWFAFIFGSAVALDVLGDGLPWLITANVIGAFLIAQSPNRKQLLGNFLIANLIVAVACGPFYYLMTLHQGQGYIQSVMWIPGLTLSRLWYDFGSVYFMHIADSVSFHFMQGPNPHLLVWSIDAALVLAVATAAWVLRRRPAMLAVLGISFLFLPMMFTIISIWRPILLPRYILWSAAPFAILAGIGAATLLKSCSPRLRVALAGCAVVLLLINMAPYYHAETKPRWDIAAKMLAQDVAPGDVVYLHDSGALPILRMYLPPGARTVVLNDATGDLKDAVVAQNQGKRVWAVYGLAGQSGETRARAKFFAKAQVLGTPKITQAAGKRIVIALYTPAVNSPGVAMTCAQSAPAASPGGCS